MAWKTKLAELLVEIKAPLGPLKSAMAKAGAIVKRGMKTLSRWARRGAVAIGVGLAAAMVWAAKKAMVQEDAEIALTAALRKTGDATESNIAKFKRYASELQKLTVYGDEEILAQMAYAKNLGVTTDKLEEAAKAAIGLAATYKLDLSAAMMLVGRASQGQTQMLTRYGIVLKEGLTDQQKFNEVLRIGADGFAIAEEQAKSTSSTLIRLWNVIGDIAERIGGPLLKRLKEVADAVLIWTKANEELIATRVGEWVDKLIIGLEKLGKVVGYVAERWKRFAVVFGIIATAPFIIAIGQIIKYVTLAGVSVLKFGALVALMAKIIGKAFFAIKAGVSAAALKKILLPLTIKMKTASKAAVWLSTRIVQLVHLVSRIIWAIKAATLATIAWTAVWVAGIGVIVTQVYLLLRALWRIRAAKKKMAEHEKAATKEEITAYKKKIRAIKDETTEKRKAAKEARKAAVEAAKASVVKKQKDIDAAYDKQKAEEQKAIDRATELEEIRQDGIVTLEKQLEMYKEMAGSAPEKLTVEMAAKYIDDPESRKQFIRDMKVPESKVQFEKDMEDPARKEDFTGGVSRYKNAIADIERKLRIERARDISKELGLPEEDVLFNLKMKHLRELADVQKRIAADVDRAVKDEQAEQKSLYRAELSALEALFTDAKGYEKQLESVKKRIREAEAKDIAAATKIKEEDALKILKQKAAGVVKDTIRIGLVGIEAAWGQVATKVSQVEREHLKESQKQTKVLEKIRTNTENIKQDKGGFG